VTDAVLIVDKVRTVRRRQFLALFADSAVTVSCVIGVAALALTCAGPRLPLRPSAALLIAPVLVVSALVARLRMPPRKGTVKLMDRVLGLEQRLETAWERLDGTEEIDRLLLEDTCRRLLPASPSTVLPVRLDRRAWTVLAASVAVAAGLGILRLLQGGAETGSHPARVSPSAADSVPARASPGRSSRGTPEQRAALAKSADTGRPPLSSDAGRASSSAQSGPETISAPEAAPETPRPAFRPTADPSSAARPGESGQPAPPATRDDVLPPRLSSGATGKPHAGASAAPGGGSAAAIAGGGAGGSPVGIPKAQAKPTRVLTPDEAALLDRFAGSDGTYRKSAEGAIAEQAIPPGFRKYIADYFRALQP